MHIVTLEMKTPGNIIEPEYLVRWANGYSFHSYVNVVTKRHIAKGTSVVLTEEHLTKLYDYVVRKRYQPIDIKAIEIALNKAREGYMIVYTMDE